MTIRHQPKPCDSPLLYASDNLSLYHGTEKPKDGEEHAHDDLQIALPMGGSFHAAWQTATGTRQRRPVPPGSLLAYASRQPHRIEVREETDLAIVWLPSPFVTRTADELDAVNSGETGAAGVVRDGFLHELCLNLLAEVRQERSPARLYVDAAANLLAAHLIRRYSHGKTAVREAGGLSRRALRLVTDYIHEHLDQDISLADLAGVARLSESRFGSLFRHSTGMSPYHYVLVRRVERAKELLSAGRLSAGEIALHVGFCDQSQFTRQFKKHVGQTPRAFAGNARR